MQNKYPDLPLADYTKRIWNVAMSTYDISTPLSIYRHADQGRYRLCVEVRYLNNENKRKDIKHFTGNIA
jgi:hypothetical protein